MPSGLPVGNPARPPRPGPLCIFLLLPLGRASPRLPADSGRSACSLRAPPPRDDPGPPPPPADAARAPDLEGGGGTDADSHTSAGYGPQSPGVCRPLPPRRPAGSPPSPLSLATASRGGRQAPGEEEPPPCPHGHGRRPEDLTAPFSAGMRGVTRPRRWRWGAGTTSPPAITSGARSSPSLSERSFPTPHGDRR